MLRMEMAGGQRGRLSDEPIVFRGHAGAQRFFGCRREITVNMGANVESGCKSGTLRHQRHTSPALRGDSDPSQAGQYRLLVSQYPVSGFHAGNEVQPPCLPATCMPTIYFDVRRIKCTPGKQ